MLRKKPRSGIGPKTGLVISIVIILITSIFSVPPVLGQTSEEDAIKAVYFTEEINDFGIDTNNDEFFDFLVINLLVGVETPGTYELGSKLILRENYPPIYVYREFETNQEFIELQLRFAGEHIFAAQSSGQYVCELWLDNKTGETIATTQYKTKEFEFSEFIHPPPPIILSERSEDFGKDTNRNNLFEYLGIKFSIDAHHPGTYLVIAGLFKELEAKEEDRPERFHFLITNTKKIFDLQDGINSLELRFKGSDIRLSELNGPYQVALWIERYEETIKEPEETSPEEKERTEELYKERLLWPMVGEGDLSGDLIFNTDEYRFNAFEEPPKIISFTGRIEERPVDLNNNGLYEFLRLIIGVNVTEPGKYFISGQIMTRDDLKNIWAENFTPLRKGHYKIVLNFKGVEINKNKLDGQYKIHIVIKGESENNIPVVERMGYLTQRKYNHEDFEAKLISDNGFEIKEGPEGITTKTDTIEVFTTRTRPEIMFWYSDSEENGYRFNLIYHRLIGYKDVNQNGRFDFGEEQFEAMLNDNLWSVNALTYSVNSEYGNYIEFELNSELNMINHELRTMLESNIDELMKDGEFEQPNIAQNWARLTFKFLITSNDLTIQNPFTYKINGGTELKIDIDLEFYYPIDIDGVCLEQILFDEEQVFGFKTKDIDSEIIYKKVDLEMENGMMAKREMQLFEPTNDNIKQSIIFIDDSEKEYGFYSWVNKINVTYFDGSSEIVSINTTYTTDGEVLRLYSNYPYRRDISAIQHDPSIGLVEESKPKETSAMDEIVKILFNPLFYVSACLIALVIIGLMRKSQMKQKSSPKQRAQIPPQEIDHEPRRTSRKLKRY